MYIHSLVHMYYAFWDLLIITESMFLGHIHIGGFFFGSLPFTRQIAYIRVTMQTRYQRQ